jgi:hypothetical protein
VVQVLVRMLGLDDGFLHIIRADVHDMGFAMVNPDDSVIVGHGESLFEVNMDSAYSH